MSCDDNTPHLTIVKADRADTGRYFCHATNDVGKDSCSSDITVKCWEVGSSNAVQTIDGGIQSLYF